MFVRSTTGVAGAEGVLTDTSRGVGERLGAAVAWCRDMAIVGAGLWVGLTPAGRPVAGCTSSANLDADDAAGAGAGCRCCSTLALRRWRLAAGGRDGAARVRTDRVRGGLWL